MCHAIYMYIHARQLLASYITFRAFFQAGDSHMLRLNHHIIPTLHLLSLWQVDRIILNDLLDQSLRNGCMCGERAAEKEVGGGGGGGTEGAEERERHAV